MFNSLAVQLGNNQGAAEQILRAHPAALARVLEESWYAQADAMDPSPEPPANAQAADVLFELAPASMGNLAIAEELSANLANIADESNWEHLIYAYFIENTGVIEVFRRIISEHFIDEKLPVPDTPASEWIHATEDLFFRDTSYFPILNISSEIRPDKSAIRRNAYYRMFGFDLDHTMEPGRNFSKATAANAGFVINLEHLLREAWIGRMHVGSFDADPTDVAEMSRTWTLLSEMLRTRKEGTRLVREEFVAVAMMSWFDLTLSYNTPAVRWLRATAESSTERLARIASLVGLRPNPRARHYFDLAPRMSILLRTIEANPAPFPADVQALYSGGVLSDTVAEITNLWSLARGTNLKAVPSATDRRLVSQPELRLLQRTTVPSMISGWVSGAVAPA